MSVAVSVRVLVSDWPIAISSYVRFVKSLILGL